MARKQTKSEEQVEEQVLNLSMLQPAAGSRRARKRLGIGAGSGQGKTSGRGQKGQKARSGGGVRRGFEGGQMPIHRRLPKRGFTSRKKIRGANIFRIVSIEQLSKIDGDSITLDMLVANGLLRNAGQKVKVLGGTQLNKKLTVEAHAFSASARLAIENAGGEARIVAA